MSQTNPPRHPAGRLPQSARPGIAAKQALPGAPPRHQRPHRRPAGPLTRSLDRRLQNDAQTVVSLWMAEEVIASTNGKSTLTTYRYGDLLYGDDPNNQKPMCSTERYVTQRAAPSAPGCSSPAT